MEIEELALTVIERENCPVDTEIFAKCPWVQLDTKLFPETTAVSPSPSSADSVAPAVSLPPVAEAFSQTQTESGGVSPPESGDHVYVTVKVPDFETLTEWPGSQDAERLSISDLPTF